MKKINIILSYFNVMLALVFFMFTGTAYAEVATENLGVYKKKISGIQDAENEETNIFQMTLVYGEFLLPKDIWILDSNDNKAISQLFIYPASHMTINDYEDMRENEEAERKAGVQLYHFAALVRNENADVITFGIRNGIQKDANRETISFSLSEALKNTTDEGEKRFTVWANIRAYAWMNITNPKDQNRIYEAIRLVSSVYSENMHLWDRDLESRRENDERDISALSILGGQLAIQETLQSDLIASLTFSGESEEDEDLISVSSISGVEVDAHPYKEMLGVETEATPKASLADCIPVDRLYLHLSDPQSVAMLIGGSDELCMRLSSYLGEGFFDYDIMKRYAARFGLTLEQVQEWVAGGSIMELAFFAPDLFFRDNTDITFIIRLKEGAVTPFSILKQIQSIVTVPVQKSSFHWTMRDGLLFVSTNKGELKSSLELYEKQGEGSLGHSDEFRVMARKLPQHDNTKGYIYFSDPFIRRFTGPEVKIGQLRRTIARAKMEQITTMALLYRMDYGKDAKNIDDLKNLGYLNAEMNTSELTLQSGCRVVSERWGSLDDLKTLLDNRVDKAYSYEVEAYENYRDNYSNYWSQYFDPIAVRVDENEDGSIDLETFILPLIDNSIYESLRSMLAQHEESNLSLPKYKSKPLLQFAFKVPAEMIPLNDFSYYSDPFIRFFPYVQEMQEQIEGTVVVSFPDADPLLQTILPKQNTLDMGMSLGRGSEMVYLGVVASALIRPCDIAIKVKDDVKVSKALDFLCFTMEEDWISFSGMRRGEGELRTFSIKVMNMLRLEFSAKVENGWLHWSNHPWTENPIIGTQKAEAAHASLEINPSSLNVGLAQAISAGQENYRRAVYSSIAEVYSWMIAYDADVSEAMKLQKAALGVFTPIPKEVKMDSVGNFYFEPYGTWGFQSSPDLFPTDDHGILENIRSIKLWMRFEDEGLRTRVRLSVK